MAKIYKQHRSNKRTSSKALKLLSSHKDLILCHWLIYKVGNSKLVCGKPKVAPPVFVSALRLPTIQYKTPSLCIALLVNAEQDPENLSTAFIDNHFRNQNYGKYVHHSFT